MVWWIFADDQNWTCTQLGTYKAICQNIHWNRIEFLLIHSVSKISFVGILEILSWVNTYNLKSENLWFWHRAAFCQSNILHSYIIITINAISFSIKALHSELFVVGVSFQKSTFWHIVCVCDVELMDISFLLTKKDSFKWTHNSTTVKH